MKLEAKKLKKIFCKEKGQQYDRPRHQMWEHFVVMFCQLMTNMDLLSWMTRPLLHLFLIIASQLIVVFKICFVLIPTPMQRLILVPLWVVVQRLVTPQRRPAHVKVCGQSMHVVFQHIPLNLPVLIKEHGVEVHVLLSIIMVDRLVNQRVKQQQLPGLLELVELMVY